MLLPFQGASILFVVGSPRVSLRLPWAMCLLGLQPTLPKSETLVPYILFFWLSPAPIPLYLLRVTFFVTIYIEIYMVFVDDRTIGRKCAILSVVV